jgi:hypothetical protein
MAVAGDVECTPLAEAHLPHASAGVEATVLCGIGPIQHVDRLADDQELRCGVAGITLNFGEQCVVAFGFPPITPKSNQTEVRAGFGSTKLQSRLEQTADDTDARCHPARGRQAYPEDDKVGSHSSLVQ